MAWRGWIETSRRVLAYLERDLRANSGLTMDDYEVLINLSEADGRKMRLSDLGASVVQSPSRLSQRIDRMERDGLVERQRSSDDGRVFFAALTDGGYAALTQAAPLHVAAVRRVLIDRLGENEIEFLAGVLPRLADEIRVIESS